MCKLRDLYSSFSIHFSVMFGSLPELRRIVLFLQFWLRERLRLGLDFSSKPNLECPPVVHSLLVYQDMVRGGYSSHLLQIQRKNLGPGFSLFRLRRAGIRALRRVSIMAKRSDKEPPKIGQTLNFLSKNSAETPNFLGQKSKKSFATGGFGGAEPPPEGSCIPPFQAARSSSKKVG